MASTKLTMIAAACGLFLTLSAFNASRAEAECGEGGSYSESGCIDNCYGWYGASSFDENGELCDTYTWEGFVSDCCLPPQYDPSCGWQCDWDGNCDWVCL